jgi:hypothetical protein
LRPFFAWWASGRCGGGKECRERSFKGIPNAKGEAASMLNIWAMLIACFSFTPQEQEQVRSHVLVIVGAAGEEQYAPQFREWSDRWRVAAEKGNANFEVIGLDAENSTKDRELLQNAFKRLVAEPTGAELWIILIGHGTWDGKVAKFNLRGPDVTAAELSDWLAPLTRPVAIINCASCSSPFMASLAGQNRVVITSTRAGSEHNFSRFGDYLSRSIGDSAADLDKDEQTSLLEAFLAASAGVREFYASESRLATEHALIDDNGDGKGTPSEWFSGLRAVKSAKEGALDGLYASQWRLIPSVKEGQLSAEGRKRRDAIEQQLETLRKSKGSQSEDEYVALIEPLLLELAQIYAAADQSKKSADPTADAGPARESPPP